MYLEVYFAMDEIIKKLNNDLAKDVMAREDARRTYQGAEREEKIAYYTGRIEYIQAMMDFVNKLNK